MYQLIWLVHHDNAQDAKGSHKYLKEVKSSDAKAGDVVIVNVGSGVSNNGHTAILLEDWKGRSTKIIETRRRRRQSQ